jgi:heptosyltransferase-2
LQEKSNHKVLVLQTAFAGDVILAAPLARGIRESIPEAEVHFLVIPQAAIILKNNPYVKKVWVYDKRHKDRGFRSFFSLMKRLRNAGFDTAIVPHRSFRSAVLVWGAKIPRRVGFHKSTGSFLFTDVIPYSTGLHEVDRNFRLIHALEPDCRVSPPELFPGMEEKAQIDDFLKNAGIGQNQKIIAVAPGSIWPTKRWPAEGFSKVIQNLWKEKVLSVLIGGEKDLELGDHILQMTGRGAVNAMGKLSILASAELIGRCCAILTNDSAPLHLGTAMGTPVAAIFGPTVPSFGFGPYGDGHIVIEKELDCRPCGIHGGRRCKKRHFDCMRAISWQEVHKALEGTIASCRNAS